MNKYEKLGRAVVGYVVAFMTFFAFAATCIIFLELLHTATPQLNLLLCSTIGAVFGLIGGAVGWGSDWE